MKPRTSGLRYIRKVDLIKKYFKNQGIKKIPDLKNCSRKKLLKTIPNYALLRGIDRYSAWTNVRNGFDERGQKIKTIIHDNITFVITSEYETIANFLWLLKTLKEKQEQQRS